MPPCGAWLPHSTPGTGSQGRPRGGVHFSLDGLGRGVLPAAPAPRRRPDARPEGAGRPGAARRNQPPTTEGGSPRQKRGGHSPRRAGAAKAAAPERLIQNNGLGGTSYPQKRARPHPARTTAAWQSTLPATAPPAGKAERAPHPPPPPHQRTGQGLPGGAGRGSTGTDQVGKPPSDGDGGAGSCPRRDRCPHPDGRARAISIRAPQGHTAFVPPSPRRNRLPPGAYGGTFRRRQRRPLGV